MIKRFVAIALLYWVALSCTAQTAPPAPYGPVPDANQLRWQQMEYYAFLHFSINTYTDQAWGNGDEDLQLFNPTKLDCRQWARVCKQAGMKGIIITAKHHSGFCLWPSKFTEYSVKNTPWKNGQGDIVRELADACKEYGLKLGIYLSPWDRNSALYAHPEYITYFRNQLKELLTNYGDIFEVWFDGANGGSGYYGGANETRKIDRKTYYDWQNTYKLARQLQPNIVIWNDNGDRADLRWVGTESGYVGETNWSLLNAEGDVPEDMLRHGVENGNVWVPGEVNTSIRPEWFYHPAEDTKVKTLPKLMDTYYNSIGRNGTLLLNFPINKEGLIPEQDAKVSAEFAKAVSDAFKIDLALNKKISASNTRGRAQKFGADKALDNNIDTYWATDDSVIAASVVIDLGKPVPFNNFLVQEYIRLGQRVKAFTVEAFINGEWKQIVKETTIGYKRILRFPTVTAQQVRFTVTDSKACPLICKIALYNAGQILTAPGIIRNQAGDIIITPADNGSAIYYTLDGSTPTPASKKYSEALPTDGKINVQTIAFDPASKKSSPITAEKFDISHKNWKVISPADDKIKQVIDGNPNSAWYSPNDSKKPEDLVIDLGTIENIAGFRYLPGQLRSSGIITHYQFFVSPDNKEWKMVSEGEFANIKNNPVWQKKLFGATKARYIKLKAVGNTQNNSVVGYGEVDIITE